MADLPAPAALVARPAVETRSWVRLVRRTTVGFALVVAASNLLILGISAFAEWQWTPPAVGAQVDGVDKLAVVDEHVWRGAAPSLEGYDSLAAAGVTTVVDLRAEPEASEVDVRIQDLGMDVVHLPVRDGQIPTGEQIAAFLAVVDQSSGTVFVHCGGGVGRTGTMAAAYLVASGQASGAEAMVRNLAVGPPSLEQLVFAGALDGDETERPPGLVVAVSRVLDAPRRLWSRFG